MSTVIVDITISLDGYVTGPGADPAHGLGIGGEPIHDWVMDRRTEQDAAILQATMERTGAVVMGRNLFDVIDGPHGWNQEAGYGGRRDDSSPAQPPYFVVCHQAPDSVRLSGFTFVTDGLHSAIAQARAAAGDRAVVVMGGGDVCRQTVEAGLADELHIHVAPILMGSGTPLFRERDGDPIALEQVDVVATDAATHLRYRVRP